MLVADEPPQADVVVLVVVVVVFVFAIIVVFLKLSDLARSRSYLSNADQISFGALFLLKPPYKPNRNKRQSKREREREKRE